jgi:hypothetical protein
VGAAWLPSPTPSQVHARCRKQKRMWTRSISNRTKRRPRTSLPYNDTSVAGSTFSTSNGLCMTTEGGPVSGGAQIEVIALGLWRGPEFGANFSLKCSFFCLCISDLRLDSVIEPSITLTYACLSLRVVQRCRPTAPTPSHSPPSAGRASSFRLSMP